MSESMCGQLKRPNVGNFSCDQARKIPKKLIMGDYEFDDDDCADSETFRTALIAATKFDSSNPNKLYAINNILDPQRTTEANKTGATGDGPVQVLVEGRPGYTYRVEIGQDLFKRLRKYNKQVIPIWTYDDAENCWGAVNSAGKFIGARAYFFISENDMQTSSTTVSALISIAYISTKQYHDEAYYMPVSLGEFEPEGQLDVYLSKKSNAANVFKIDLKIPTAQKNAFINISEKYSTELVVGLLSAKTGAGFATPLDITSVAYDAVLKCLTVTFDSDDYTALANGALIKLSLANIAALEAANITGLEGVPVILTKAA